MAKLLKGWQLLKADRIMLLVAAGLIIVLAVSQFLDIRARHRDSIRQADLYTLQLSVQKYYALNGYYPTSLDGLAGIANDDCQDPKFGGNCTNPGYIYQPLAASGKLGCDNHELICRNYQLSSQHMETTINPLVLSNF